MITFTIKSSILDYQGDIDIAGSTKDGVISLLTEVDSLTATGMDVEMIFNRFSGRTNNHHIEDKYCTVPMAFDKYKYDKLPKTTSATMTWYGDIAKTILANIIPLLYPES